MVSFYKNKRILEMREVKFDVMLNGRYQCTLKYRYCPLFPIEESDIRKFVVEQRPTLRHTDFTIAL